MKARRFHGVAAFLLTAGATAVFAATGDVVDRIDLRPICDPNNNFTGAVTFDGSTLYYTVLFFVPNEPVIHKVDAKTHAYLGSVLPTRGGSPFPSDITHFAYDGIRQCLWTTVGPGPEFGCIPITGGDSIASVFPQDTQRVYTIEHDPFEDVVFCSDKRQGKMLGWRMDNIMYAPYLGPPQIVIGVTYTGAGLWNFTTDMLPLPAPQVGGVFFPTDMTGEPDYAQAFVASTWQYTELAYDCTTFPVAVIWASLSDKCELVALEVPRPPGPCINGPKDRLLRAVVAKPVDTNRTAELPVTSVTADWVWGARVPLATRDDLYPILGDLDRPLVFYRLLGPQDVPVPRTIKLIKDVAADAVIIQE